MKRMKLKKLNLFLLTAGSILVSCTGNAKKSSDNMKKEYEKGHLDTI